MSCQGREKKDGPGGWEPFWVFDRVSFYTPEACPMQPGASVLGRCSFTLSPRRTALFSLS